MSSSASIATVLLSGGMDSAACAKLLLAKGNQVNGLFIDFGQAAAHMEHAAATDVAKHLAIRLDTIKLSGIKSTGPGELNGRNAFLITTALFLRGNVPGLIALGLHAETPYYDCSPLFVERMSLLVREHTDSRTQLIAPFLLWSKRDIFDYLRNQQFPIDQTYSCEAGTMPVCGNCMSCRDQEALRC